MQMEAIESLLSRRIGMDMRSVGQAGLIHAVRRRMDAIGIATAVVYADFLHRSEEEFEHLVEQVVIPETWFFRDRESFEFLKRCAKRLLSVHAGRELRILSLPCSSGEEPYSIAMALCDAGLSSREFHIDAVDLSKTALEKAAQAVYGRNSFRGPDLLFRDRYFDSIDRSYRLRSAVLQPVTFRQANLLNYATAGLSYHIIFCKNLLIYFDLSARKKAIHVLDSLLRPNGFLFVGHAESGGLLSPRFTALKPLNAFVHTKSVSAEDETRTDRYGKRRVATNPCKT